MMLHKDIEVVVQYEQHNLPALIDRASARLIAARTSAEVLEAKAFAEAILHYAKVTKAANETHADCLRIITRAEIRMASEIDKGQEKGEVAKPGDDKFNVRTPDIKTLDDLRIPRQRVYEWRKLQKAGEPLIEATIQQALAEDRAPTKNEIMRAIDDQIRITKHENTIHEEREITKTTYLSIHEKHAKHQEEISQALQNFKAKCLSFAQFMEENPTASSPVTKDFLNAIDFARKALDTLNERMHFNV